MIKIISITPDCEQVIEEAGRTCYQSEVGNPKIIQAWIKSGHESVIEHASVTFRINDVSRALSHQLVRHRIASYSQQSQRYVSEEQFSYITPEKLYEKKELLEMYNQFMSRTQNFYNLLVKGGIKKEDARFVLPNACTTEIVVTMNFRSLRNFLKLRLDKHAQWEIREVANKMLILVKQYAPNVFNDLEEI